MFRCVCIHVVHVEGEKDEKSMCVLICSHMGIFCKLKKKILCRYAYYKNALQIMQSEIMLSAYFQGWFEGDPFSVACITVGIALCLNQKTTSLNSFISSPHFTETTLN